MQANCSTFCAISDEGKKVEFPNDLDEGTYWKSAQGEAALNAETEKVIEMKVKSSTIGHVAVGIAKKLESYETYAHNRPSSYMIRFDADFFALTKVKEMGFTPLSNDQEYKVKLVISLDSGNFKTFIDGVDIGYGVQNNEEMRNGEWFFTVSSLRKADIEILQG